MKFSRGPQGHLPGQIRNILPSLFQPTEPAASPTLSVTSAGKQVSPPGYMTVKEYAKHRRLCEKTIRKYLHHLPGSSMGGRRIKWAEADKVMDSMQIKTRRKPRGKARRNKAQDQ